MKLKPMSPKRVARLEQLLLGIPNRPSAVRLVDIRRYRRYVRLLGGKTAARRI